MTVWWVSGSVPFGWPARTDGVYYDSQTFAQAVGSCLLCWEHWRDDDDVARLPARYTSAGTRLIVDAWLDDDVVHEARWLDAIRAGGVYLSHAIYGVAQTPDAARQALARIRSIPPEEVAKCYRVQPLRHVTAVDHFALVLKPDMVQDEPVRVVAPAAVM